MSDCVCLACRTHLIATLLTACGECSTFVCPACGTHGKIIPFGAYVVPPAQAASVRASVWGRPN